MKVWHLAPQVAHRVGGLACAGQAIWFRVAGWVACGPVVASVEGQKESGRAVEPGGHVDQAVAHGEMHHGSALEAQQGFGASRCLAFGRAVVFVLRNGGLHRLGEIGLEFDGGHGQAVDEAHQVDFVVVVLGVTQLGHHAQDVAGIALSDGFVAFVFGQALAHFERAATGDGKAVAQYRDGSAVFGFQRFGQAVEHGGGGAGRVHAGEFVPGSGLAAL